MEKIAKIAFAFGLNKNKENQNIEQELQNLKKELSNQAYDKIDSILNDDEEFYPLYILEKGTICTKSINKTITVVKPQNIYFKRYRTVISNDKVFIEPFNYYFIPNKTIIIGGKINVNGKLYTIGSEDFIKDQIAKSERYQELAQLLTIATDSDFAISEGGHLKKYSRMFNSQLDAILWVKGCKG